MTWNHPAVSLRQPPVDVGTCAGRIFMYTLNLRLSARSATRRGIETNGGDFYATSVDVSCVLSLRQPGLCGSSSCALAGGRSGAREHSYGRRGRVSRASPPPALIRRAGPFTDARSRANGVICAWLAPRSVGLGCFASAGDTFATRSDPAAMVTAGQLPSQRRGLIQLRLCVLCMVRLSTRSAMRRGPEQTGSFPCDIC